MLKPYGILRSELFVECRTAAVPVQRQVGCKWQTDLRWRTPWEGLLLPLPMAVALTIRWVG